MSEYMKTMEKCAKDLDNMAIKKNTRELKSSLQKKAARI